MSISGRVPLLLLLGVGAVVLRPEMSTVWLWVLAVAAAGRRSTCCSRRRPAALALERPPVGTVRLGEPTATRAGRDQRLAPAAARRRARRVAADRRRHRQPAPDRARRPATGSVLTHAAAAPPARRPARRRRDRPAARTARAGRRGSAPGPVDGAVRALPPFDSRKHLPSRLARLRDLDGRAAVRVRGQGTEFDSLREYVRGDDVRSIDWRASARNRNVVVRTWQPERDRRVVLVLDTSRTSAGRVGDVPRLDSAMDAALLLAALAARAGDRVDFVAGDRRVRSRLRFAGDRDVAAQLQEAMADLDPVIAEADWGALAGAVNGLGRQRALVVLLTPLEPSAVEEGLLPVLPALTRHHRVVLASVRDPELEQLTGARGHPRRGLRRRRGRAGHRPAPAHRRAAARARGRRRRRRRDLPPALADHYLALKARGLL